MKHPNPWGLTPRQSQVMDRLCGCGCVVQVAAELRISRWTAKRHLLRARERMAHPETGEMPNGLVASSAWAVHRAEQGVMVSAVYVPNARVQPP